jgi:hypothetical protein
MDDIAVFRPNLINRSPPKQLWMKNGGNTNVIWGSGAIGPDGGEEFWVESFDSASISRAEPAGPFSALLRRSGCVYSYRTKEVQAVRQLVPRIAATVALSFFVAGQAPAASPRVEDDVMQVDEAYRIAKLHRDTRALDRILADAFNETNQNGNSRNKAQSIELWRSFSIESLTTDTSEVRVTGGTAMVTGTQTENGSESMLFTRVYVQRPSGWQLLASMQFQNPNPSNGISGNAVANRPRGVEGAVMQVDEAYRIAKLHQDTKALDRILADAFNETNQNGNSRNKAQSIELWKSFSIESLTTDTSEVRVTGDTAMVTGTQTENRSESMLFTRVYVERPSGWQLLASMQFRNPNPPAARSFSDAVVR